MQPAAEPRNQSITADSRTRIALMLSLGAALSLGITRFAYGLLLPPMRDDLGWSYALAGAMNTSNAAGYLVGALLTPLLLRRFAPAAVMVSGALASSILMAISGLFTDATVWLALRLAAGVASALVFVSGGLLAARLGAVDPKRAGLLIGLYYGGTGLGICVSALVVPLTLAATASLVHPWAWAWGALSLACFAATDVLRRVARRMAADPASPVAPAATTSRTSQAHVPLRRFAPALAGYAMFGVGYIGYMTFIVALLRDEGLAGSTVMACFGLLGIAVMLSPRLWAGLLDRSLDGRALALLNALVGVATMAPALSSAWPVVLASSLLFGSVFLSVVASTTAWVRHNLPASQWAAGIGAFTIVFAAGQIVGPTVVGWIADGPGGLARGFVVSAICLWLGAGMAMGQAALPRGEAAVG